MEAIEVDYEALPDHAPLVHQLMAGAFAGIMEHSVIFPLDALKTRLQAMHAVSTTGGQPIPSTMLRQLSSISASEGSLVLWKGVQSVLLGAGPAHAVYFATYEMVKSALIDESTSTSRYHPFKTAFAGASATVAADALMNPFDVIKQRIQLNTNISVFETAKNIYKKEGFQSFYYSYPTTLAINIPFAAFNFGFYDTATKFFNPSGAYNPFIHCLCGGISGAACAGLTTPLDCIKTALQVRGSEKVSLEVFKQADTFKKATNAIYQTYGWRGFWKGVKPRILANMPATAISWTAYEFAKHFLLHY